MFLEKIKEGLDGVLGGVEVVVVFSFPERVVAVEVSKPDHMVIQCGMYKGKGGGKVYVKG